MKGNLVPDAYLAALAIESGSEWATTDRDYGRFSELRWRDLAPDLPQPLMAPAVMPFTNHSDRKR